MGILFALIMSFAVDSKNAVVASGEVPAGVEAVYACSYQRGTVRAGDQAVLSLSGLGGMTVEAVKLYMRSNKTGGAGTITVMANDLTVGTLSGSYATWVGAFDNATAHAIGVLSSAVQEVRTMEITITGTENSLYVDRFEISYQPAPPHTVTLMNGRYRYGTLTESESGAGVVLPALPDTAGWTFLGWTPYECYTVYTMPECIPAYTHVYPTGEAVLWALYRWLEEEPITFMTDLQSGVYLYVNTVYSLAMSEAPKDGRLGVSYVDPTDSAQYYTIDFFAPDSAYVTHTQSGTPVGMTSTRITATHSPWRVYHEGDETVLYKTVGDKNYVLWIGQIDSHTGAYYTDLLVTKSEMTGSPLKLLLPIEVHEPAFSCHPEYGVGVERPNEGVNELTNEWVMPFGPYDLHIHDGQKRLVIRE